MRFVLAFGLLLGFGVDAAAQPTRPVPTEMRYGSVEEQASRHRIGHEEAVHWTAEEIASPPGKPWELPSGYGFELIVSENGVVESVRPLEKAGPHLAEAEAIAKARRYRPWMKDGIPIRVKVQDFVELLPPERWGSAVTFPEPPDMATVVMELHRSTGNGGWPEYTVAVRGDGTVVFDGGYNSRIAGHHLAHVSKDAAAGLMQEFRQANFLSARPAYRRTVTDNRTQVLTLRVNGLEHEVEDYAGVRVGMPLAIHELEDEVDRVAGSERWVEGKAGVIEALDAEKWNFGAGSAANLTIYDAAIEGGDGAMLDRLLKAGTPVTARIERSEKTLAVLPPVCVASGIGKDALVTRMLVGVKEVPGSVANLCLRLSAKAGDLTLVNLWLERGADPTTATSDDWQGLPAVWGAIRSGKAAVVARLLEFKVDLTTKVQGNPVLFAVMECRDHCDEEPEIVRMLVKAGADVTVHDRNGNGLVFSWWCTPEVLAALLEAGADIESRDGQGETTLMHYAKSEVIVRGLLARGANPVAKDNSGRSVYQAVKDGGCEPCLAMVEAELNKRGVEAR